ncbi:response regulator [Amphritea sp.]|uniref:response regulator n=1 Tax=Amphritea sp. TaxID=1872502 RepID=UPI003A8F529B
MKTLSTGDIAQWCDVNLRTVIRWIEKGDLKGFKLPGRGNNRVLVEDFIAFLDRHGMPVPEELQSFVNSRVLIVDDEEAITRAIRRALRPAGFETLIAHDGFQAGSLLMQEKPALMTLDLSMPGLDGFAVLEFVRQQPNLSGLKILVVSALDQHNLDRALQLGADQVLSKPFTEKELLDAVEGLLGSVTQT